MTLSTRNAVILLAMVVGVALLTLWIMDSSTFYAWRQDRMVERVLGAEPLEFISSGRTLLARRPGFVGEISASSSDVPKAIRRLKPTLISFSTNSLSVDFSDVLNPFGIIVYAAGANPPVGVGSRKWIDGLWVYEDGNWRTTADKSVQRRQLFESRRDISNITGGWLPSLTSSLGRRTHHE